MTPDRFSGMFAPTTLSIGLLLSLAWGGACYFATAQAIEADALTRFRSMSRAAQSTIDARIASYGDVLRGVAGLFRVAPDTSADQFRHYVEQLDIHNNFPALVTINYARAVHASMLPVVNEELSERLQRRGVGKFNPVRPAADRVTHTVLVYMEPLPQQLASKLGLDLEARHATRRALAEARDTGQLSASGTRIALQWGPDDEALALRLPVYRHDMPTRTTEQRRLAYIGSVGLGFGITSLVKDALDEFPLNDVRLVLTDLSEVTPEPGETPANQILFDSLSSRVLAPATATLDGGDAFATSLPIEFHQRLWRADFSVPKAALYTRFDRYYPWLAAIAGFISAALLYALFQTMASSRRNALRMAGEMTRELRASQAKLQASNAKLRQLAAHAEQIKEGERKRIAREIHDDLAQNMLALKIEAEMLSNRTRKQHPHLHARATATVRQIDATIRSVRQIINDLRPNVLDLGLSAAVDWQVAEFSRRTGIICEMVDADGEHRIDDRCATAFFRILQESLSNVARHAHATRVWIELHQHDDVLTMTIRDNGVGMPVGSRYRSGSFGLVGIEERVNILGGAFSVSSATDSGTTIMVSIPVHAPEDQEVPASTNSGIQTALA